MKKYIATTLSFSALLATSAVAADLPSIKSAPATPVPMWTGFYAGLNSGYGWGLTPGSYTQAPLFYDERAVKFTGSPSGLGAANSGTAIINQSGYLGGGQIGFNYQFKTNYLVGLETDMQGAAIGGQGYYSGAGATINDLARGAEDIYRSGGSGQTQASINWLGSVRGRFGYLITPRFLTYATGGLSYGGVSTRNYFNTRTNEYITSNSSELGIQQELAGSGRASTTLMGWNIGGGAEWMVSPNWSIKSEVLYYNLGSLTFGGWGYSPGFSSDKEAKAVVNSTTVNFAGIIARAGINYHLQTDDKISNPTMVLANFINPASSEMTIQQPRSWSGFYAGLNSGYGWSGHGLKTTSDSYDGYAYKYIGEAQPGAAGSVQPINGLAQANSGWSSVKQSGFFGGLQAGYNAQLAKYIVAGVETDIQGSTMQGSGSYSGLAKVDFWDSAVGHKRTEYVQNIFGNGSLQTAMNWFGSLRIRLGYLITPQLLAYGTAGMSYGGVAAQTNFSSATNYVDDNGVSLGQIRYAQILSGKGQSTASLVGWLAGAGIEWMLASNWSLKTEALYYDLGYMNLNGNGYSPAAEKSYKNGNQFVNTKTSILYDGVIARMGVNYHFELGKELPVIAKF